MEITGKIVKVLDTRTGASANGVWYNRNFVVEYGEDTKKIICFSVFGEEKCNALGRMQVGAKVSVKFNIESREYQGKYYTDCKCYDIALFNSISRPNYQVQEQMPQMAQGYQQPMQGYQQPMQGYQQMPPQMQQKVNMLQQEFGDNGAF